MEKMCENPKIFTFSQHFVYFHLPFKNEKNLLSISKEGFHCIYVNVWCEICIYVYELEEWMNAAFELGKEEKFCEKGKDQIRPVLGWIAEGFWKKIDFTSVLNPAWNPAGLWRGTGGHQLWPPVSFVLILLLAPKYLHFFPCSAVHHREKKESSSFPSFNFCSNLEISPLDFQTTPYKGILRWFKAFDGVIFEREVLRCYLSWVIRWVAKKVPFCFNNGILVLCSG